MSKYHELKSECLWKHQESQSAQSVCIISTYLHHGKRIRPSHFCSCNVVGNEAHFVLECPFYNPINDMFSSLFENVVPGSFESFFQLDHQVNISLYLTESTSLHRSRELTGLKPSWCAFSPIRPFGFPDFKIDFIALGEWTSLQPKYLVLQQENVVLDSSYSALYNIRTKWVT